jgi:hypothetical protein
MLVEQIEPASASLLQMGQARHHGGTHNPTTATWFPPMAESGALRAQN